MKTTMQVRLGGIFVTVLGMCLMHSAAFGEVCYRRAIPSDATSPVVHWATMPIKYFTYVPANTLKIKVTPSQAVDAIKSSFKRYELACTNLKFEHAGTLSELVTRKDNSIVVYFGHDSATWIYGNQPFFQDGEVKDFTKGEAVAAEIGLNAKDYAWTVGAATATFDIESVLVQIIPMALGYYAGPNAYQGLQYPQYDSVSRDLTVDQIAGAQYVYFAAGSECKKPTTVGNCADAKPLPDGGLGDLLVGYPDGAGFVDDGSSRGGFDAGLSGADLGPASPAPSGCCRVGHADGADLLSIVVVVGMLWVRRGRRSKSGGR